MIESLLNRTVKCGDLTLRLPGGRVLRVGDGTGAPVVIRLTSRGVRRIVLNPGLGLGEAFMEEDLVFEQGSIWDLLEIVGRSGGRAPKARGSLPKRMLRG